jgi:hypothetical protein
MGIVFTAIIQATEEVKVVESQYQDSPRKKMQALI